MTDSDGIARLGAALNERHGKLDILIGNAGVAGTSSPLGHTDPKYWDNVMAVNVTANFQLIRCMEPLLQKSDAGRAVLLTSGVAHRASAYMGPYAVSKAAVEMLGLVWANETATTPLRVNMFSPRTDPHPHARDGHAGRRSDDSRYTRASRGVHRADVRAVMDRDRKAVRLPVEKIDELPLADRVVRASRPATLSQHCVD